MSNKHIDPIFNTSTQPHFQDVLTASLANPQRRSMLLGGLGLAGLASCPGRKPVAMARKTKAKHPAMSFLLLDMPSPIKKVRSMARFNHARSLGATCLFEGWARFRGCSGCDGGRVR